MGKYWVVLVMGWMTLAAAGEKADESLAGKDPNQVEAGEKEAENTGAAQAQPGDANKRLKKTDRMEEKFSVRELLERYAANQKLAFTSFIHKTETREDRDIHCTEQHGGISARFLKDTKYYEHEVRTDGSREKCIFSNWGQVRENIVLSRDNRGYVSWLWDGDKAYSYSRYEDPSDAGILILRPDGPPDKSNSQQIIFAGHIGAATWGYLFGDVERFDEMLLKATNITVRNRKEKIRRVSNYVIEAVNERGSYTIWIDPEHGYNFSKAVVYRRAGDKAFQIVLQPGEEYMAVVENTKFQEIDGVWIPWEATMENQRKFANGDYTYLRKSLKVLSMKINPDHEALGSFLTDDIRNGAETWIYGIPSKDYTDYTWQDSKVVDKAGKVVDKAGKVVDKAGKVVDLHASKAADPNKPIDPNQPEAGEKADESLAGKDPNQAAAAKEMAPLFTVQSLEGKEIRLEDYRGKVVLLYFWATWCRPCVHKLPNMKKFYEEMRKFDQFEMIGLSMDESEGRLIQLIRQYDLTWPQARIGTKSQIATDYKIAGAPQYILIGPEGEILARDLNEAALKTVLDR